MSKANYANARAKKKLAARDYSVVVRRIAKTQTVARIASESNSNPLLDKLSYNGFNLSIKFLGKERELVWNQEPSPLMDYIELIDFTPNCEFVVALFNEVMPGFLLRVVDNAGQILWQRTTE